MKTVQMTLDEDLVRDVDRLARRLRTTRSAFTRAALREAVSSYEVARLEERQREGYRRHPPSEADLAGWESEQVWGDP